MNATVLERMTQREAAEYLGISVNTLLRLRKAGKIGYQRPGGRVYYTPEHIAKFLQDSERIDVPGRRPRAPRQRHQAAAS